MSKAVSTSSRVSTFRTGEPMSEEEAQKTWEALKEAIQHIYNHNAGTLSFEELYRNAYSLVLHKHGGMLYSGVEQCVTEYVNNICKEVAAESDDTILQTLNNKWHDHKTTMQMIRDILMYMDRNYVVTQRKVQVYPMGLNIFRCNVIESDAINLRLRNILLNNILLERQGYPIDKRLMKNIIQILIELSVDGIHKQLYKDFFEFLFLEETREFYQRESQEYLTKFSVAEFLQKAEKRFAEESSRIDDYLDSETRIEVTKLMAEVWIKNHFQTFMYNEKTGCASLFQDDKIDDMKRLYTLLQDTTEAMPELIKIFKECIFAAGDKIISHPEHIKDPIQFVQQILNLKAKYDAFIKNSFRDSKEFQCALKMSFEGFINKDTRTAHFLSLYVDDLFKKSLKGMSETEIDLCMDRVLTIFRFLTDKDVFENFYKQHLAKRLLLQRSLSEDNEKVLITRLKTECGHVYTSKLEGMFKDISLSEDISKEYKQTKNSDGPDLRVAVLTTGIWPTENIITCELPSDVQNECKKFELFYLSKHSGRRLTWQHSQGVADIRATFPKGRHELNCSSFQMVILNVFNLHKRITYKGLQTITNIPPNELRRHLISLYASPKCKILHKISISGSKIKELMDEDIIEPNDNFESPMLRLKVPLVAYGSKGFEENPELEISGKLPPNVEQDRNHLIEAAIVRVMKMRKKSTHNELIVEVTKHLKSRFVPCPQVIKQRIEKLIEREYLERDSSDRKSYKYLA